MKIIGNVIFFAEMGKGLAGKMHKRQKRQNMRKMQKMQKIQKMRKRQKMQKKQKRLSSSLHTIGKHWKSLKIVGKQFKYIGNH